MALIIPAAALGGLTWFRRVDRRRLRLLAVSILPGLVIFSVTVLPWFLQIFSRIPSAFGFMVKGQLMGHALGTTIHNRQGSLVYYVWILLIGSVPWTLLLGWLWRRKHWQHLDATEKDGWVLLCTWFVFTTVFFTLCHSKLPAYVLPLFPALSVLLAWRWFSERPLPADEQPPAWTWKSTMVAPALLACALPLVVHFALHAAFEPWMVTQLVVCGILALGCAIYGSRFSPRPVDCAALAVCFTVLSFGWVLAVFPRIETALKGNQTLKPLALALKEEYRPGDKVVCWHRFPQGLLFYSFPVLCSTNRPLLGGMPLDKVPFEFPGNAERFGPLLLSGEKALADLLNQDRRVWVVGYAGTHQHIQQLHQKPLRLVKKVGQFELFSN